MARVPPFKARPFFIHPASLPEHSQGSDCAQGQPRALPSLGFWASLSAGEIGSVPCVRQALDIPKREKGLSGLPGDRVPKKMRGRRTRGQAWAGTE